MPNRTYKKNKIGKCYGQDTYYFIRDMCRHLIEKPHPLIVPVYKFRYLNCITEGGEKKYRYRYTMKRLTELSRMERTTLGTAVYGDPTKLSDEQRHEHAHLIAFLHEVKSLGFYYDLHEYNVMKDDGRYFLIDMEGFVSPSHIPHIRRGRKIKRWWESK